MSWRDIVAPTLGVVARRVALLCIGAALGLAVERGWVSPEEARRFELCLNTGFQAPPGAMGLPLETRGE